VNIEQGTCVFMRTVNFSRTSLLLASLIIWPLFSSPADSEASLRGIDAGEAKLFKNGRERFSKTEDVAAGLGPAYNGTSCAGCHDQPAAGGVGNVAVIRAGILRNGHYEIPPGGDLIHLFSIGDHSCQPRILADANNVARRIPTPLFGAGLIEAIPDLVIRSWEDSEDRNHDGIRGRAAIVLDPATQTMRVSRFGWKAHQATLLAFAAEALRNEMGITNDLYPDEIASGISSQQLAKCDAVPDPEDRPDPQDHLRMIDHLTNFMRFLAPPPTLPLDDQGRAGLQLFSKIGCASCHVPTLLTGPNEIAALDHKAVNAYSDFLLHDVGTGDGVEQGAAKGNEFRTSPLWGLRFRKLLLHDGSALSPTDAIRRHGVEGERSREAFDHLGEREKQALLVFLNSI